MSVPVLRVIRATDADLLRLFIPVEEGGYWPHVRAGVPPFMPSGQVVGSHVCAIVNDNRWIVVCPSCPSAQIVHPATPRFFCVDCCNREWGAAWLPAAWPIPEHLAAIEAALEARPYPDDRWWSPDITIDWLVAENHHHGLVDVDNECVAGDIGYSGYATLAAPAQSRALPWDRRQASVPALSAGGAG